MMMIFKLALVSDYTLMIGRISEGRLVVKTAWRGVQVSSPPQTSHLWASPGLTGRPTIDPDKRVIDPDKRAATLLAMPPVTSQSHPSALDLAPVPPCGERKSLSFILKLTDGSVKVKLTTSSAAWLARWILPFGINAELLTPPEQRESLGKLCREAAAVYGRPVH
jgi:hypothetical protein